MVLADGICFACENFMPDYVVDIATLTAVHTIATVIVSLDIQLVVIHSLLSRVVK